MSRGTSGSAFSLTVNPAVVCCTYNTTTHFRYAGGYVSFLCTSAVNSTSSSRCRERTFRTSMKRIVTQKRARVRSAVKQCSNRLVAAFGLTEIVLSEMPDAGASSPLPLLLSTEPTLVMPLKCQQSTLHTGKMPSRSTPVVHHKGESRCASGVFNTLPRRRRVCTSSGDRCRG